jgi:hypothetical protein
MPASYGNAWSRTILTTLVAFGYRSATLAASAVERSLTTRHKRGPGCAEG